MTDAPDKPGKSEPGKGRRSGHKPGRMPEWWREKIKTGKLLEKANKIALGEEAARKDQTKAILGLLAKVLPDLKENKNDTTLSGELIINVYGNDKPPK